MSTATQPSTSGATTKTVGVLNADEVKELRRKAEEFDRLTADNATAQNALRENQELKNRLLAQETEREQAGNTAFRSKLLEHAAQEAPRLNIAKFEGVIPAETLTKIAKSVVENLPDAEIKRLREDRVEGEEKGRMRVKEEIYSALTDKYRELQSYEAVRRQKEIYGGGLLPANVNILPEERRQLGLHGEKTYWSDEKRIASKQSIREQMMNFLLTAMLKKPIIRENGTSWIDQHRTRLHLDDVIKAQRFYDQTNSEGHIFSRGGRLFNLFAQEDVQNRLARMFVSEANEMTTANTVGTGVSNLALDATTAVILGSWPRLLAKRIAAQAGVMTKTTKRVREIGVPRDNTQVLRQGQRFFGAVDSDNPSTLATTFTGTTNGLVCNDEGTLVRASGHIPQDVYGIVCEVVDATTTITVTGVNQNGDTSATATATFLTSHAVGDVVRFTPTFAGDTFLDITAVTSSGWTDAAAKGEVGIFTPDPITGHTAGSPAQQARFIIRSSDVSESQYDLQTNMTLAVLEDLEMSLRSDDGDGIDGIAQMLSLLQSELFNMIDRRLFDTAVQNVFTGNQNTFNANTPTGEYSDQKWKERLHYYQKDTNMRVQVNSGYAPNWIVWSLYDEPSFSEWLTQGGMLHRLSPEANDPFADGKAQFRIGNCDVYVSENLAPEFILHGNNQNFGIHSYDYIPLKVLQGANVTAGFEQVLMIHHRGYHGVPATDKIYGGRAIGYTKVNRRS